MYLKIKARAFRHGVTIMSLFAFAVAAGAGRKF